MSQEKLQFHWADYVVLALFISLSAFIGVIVGFLNRKKKMDAKAFLTGGGDMHWFPVSMSMTASFLSAIFVISIPAEIYIYGSTFTFLAIACFIGHGIAAHVYLPIFHRLQLTNGYQYLEMRFNKAVRLFGSFTFSIMIILYSGVVVYTPSLSLSQVSGLPTSASIGLVGIVVTFYTVVGGLKAAIWNDTIQAAVILINFVMIIVFGSIDAGGIGEVLRIAKEGGRDTLYDPQTYNPDPFIRTTFWTQTIGGTFLLVVLFGGSQSVIQKFLSLKTVRDGQIAVWISGVTISLCTVLVFFAGCTIYAKYQFCDPIEGGLVEKNDQIVANFVLEIMGHLPGLPGLFLAAAFSATLSTVASAVTALGAVYLEDLVAPLYKHFKGKTLEASTGRNVTRLLSVLFAAIIIGIAFLAEVMGSLMVQLTVSIYGMVGGPLIGVLTLGIFFPFVNSWGALAGLFTSLGLTTWIGIGAILNNVGVDPLPTNTSGCDTFTDPVNFTTISPIETTSLPEEPADFLKIYELSYNYYSLFAVLVAVLVGILVSLITGGNTDPEKRDPRYYYFFQDSICLCCPGSCRTACRCGIDEKDDEDFDDSKSREVKFPVPEGEEIGVFEDNEAIYENKKVGELNSYVNEAFSMKEISVIGEF